MINWVRKFIGGKTGHAPRPVAWSSVAAFLEDLEVIGEEHPELYDTDTRRQLWEVADAYLVKMHPELIIPAYPGTLSDTGNDKVRAVLEQNLPHLRDVFKVFELNEERRRASLLNPRLTTEKGRHVDDFLSR